MIHATQDLTFQAFAEAERRVSEVGYCSHQAVLDGLSSLLSGKGDDFGGDMSFLAKLQRKVSGNVLSITSQLQAFCAGCLTLMFCKSLRCFSFVVIPECVNKPS